METLQIEKNYNSKEIKVIVDYLKNEKVIAIATDTIYGFSAKFSSHVARKKISKLKNRSKKQYFVILISSLNMLRNYCIVSSSQEKYLKKIWPGNISVILQAKDNLEITVGLAVRFPKNDYLLKIIRQVKEPIISTSVNISGFPSILKGEEILEKWQFVKDKPDLVVLDKEVACGKASQIIDIRDMKNIKIIRK